MDPYDILGISRNASKEDIKKAYKDIALTCHPDKLSDINITEKNKKIELFKNASIAYKLISDGKYDYIKNDIDFSNNDWKETWKYFFNNKEDSVDILTDTFKDIASIFINNNLKPRSYYTPTNNSDIIKHSIKLNVSYKEVYCNIKKKLRLILKFIKEPIFLDIYCGKYPQIIKNYIDDDSIEHEITINLILEKHDRYHHVCGENYKINLITTVEISLRDYICGNKIDLDFINNDKISVDIPQFEKNFIIKKGFGLLNEGDLIINILIKIFEKTEWTKLLTKDKDDMIRILNAL
jgi:DnaJ-class molecular chaperone